MIGTLVPDRPKPEPQLTIKSVWLQNWTILVGVCSVAFISARLLGASAGDPETAYAILQATGTGSVVVGSMIPMIGLLVFPLVAAGAFVGYFEIKAADPTNLYLYTILGCACGPLVLFAAPAFLLLVSIAFTLGVIAVIMITRFLHNRKSKLKFRSYLPSRYVLVIVYLLGVIGTTATSSDPWLPPQNIVTEQMPTFSGYILTQTDQAVTILTKDPTAVIQLPSKQVISTEICKRSDYRFQEATVSQMLGIVLPGSDRAVSYPDCMPSYFQVKPK